MRKNFTQLFLGLALMVGFVTMGYSQCEIDPPAGAYYNYQFDGGLDGWRTLGQGNVETENGWFWSETGDLSLGAYGPPFGSTIASESQCNGAVVMDSDFLDNNGVQDAFGTGPCPSPCDGYLVSPILDFSSAPTGIEMIFTQSIRQLSSDYYIYVSIDGGASNRDTFRINEDIEVNAPTVITTEVRQPLCDVQGQANVVITIHYASDYYFWAIDDVSFIESDPSVDMKVNNNFFTKVSNYATPRNMGITVPILADIENIKVNASPPSVLNYRVRNSVNQELFSATRDYPPVPGCSTDENKLFDAMYTMPDETGLYSIEFEIEATGDVNQENNIITAPFRITEREFRKLPTEDDHGSPYISGFRYGDGLVSWGSYFQIPKNIHNQTIESITFGYSTNATDSIPSSGFIYAGIYQWFDFENFGEVDNGERVLLGEADFIIGLSEEFHNERRITLEVKDVITGEPIILPTEGDAQILVVMSTAPFNDETNYFFYGADIASFPNYSPGANNLAHELSEIVGGFGSFANSGAASIDDRHDRTLFNVDGNGGVSWDISMLISPPPTVGTEDINEDLNVSIFPSPASDKLNVDVNLTEVSPKVSIELMDMTGNRVAVHNFSNIKKERLSIDVSELTSGMYLLNLRTEEGMISKKISVLH